jgi:hypothetical protein
MQGERELKTGQTENGTFSRRNSLINYFVLAYSADRADILTRTPQKAQDYHSS